MEKVELPSEVKKALEEIESKNKAAANDWLAAFAKKSNDALAKRAAEKQTEKLPDERALIETLASKDHTEYDRMRSELADTLGIRLGTLDAKVGAIRKKRKREAPKDTAPVVDAAKARADAGDLITCPDLLARFELEVTRAGLVGETNNAKILFLALTSRRFSRPVSVAVKGVSSGGKSFTVESVLKFFPPSAYFSRTGWSEKAAYYSEEDFRHRFIVLYEAAGGEGETQAYIIRTLLSEGRLEYELVEKTDEGIRARKIVKEGPTGLITTTTQAKLHPENETRLLSLGVIDTQDQTKAIMRVLAADAAHAVDYAPWWAFQEWLTTGERRVVVPFSRALAEAIPPIAVRLRRDFGALLSLIRAHALLHRESRLQDDQGRIVATAADYKAVYDLVERLFAEGIEATVSRVVKETVQAVREYLERTKAPAITLTQLAKELGLDKNSVHHRMKKAITAGYLFNQEERRGNPARIVLGEALLPEEGSLLPEPGVLECLEEYPLVGHPPEITPTLQHPTKTPDGARRLAVGPPHLEAPPHPNATVGCVIGTKGPSPTVKSLAAQRFRLTVGVLEPNPEDDHLPRHCTQCGKAGTAANPIRPCGHSGEPYHLPCWQSFRTGAPALGPVGDSLEDLT
jgi:hypothetical protein